MGSSLPQNAKNEMDNVENWGEEEDPFMSFVSSHPPSTMIYPKVNLFSLSAYNRSKTDRWPSSYSYLA